MTNNPRGIPAGVTFGNQVVVIPPTLQTFDRPLYIQTNGGGRAYVPHEQYTWIARGDTLVEYTKIPRTTPYSLDN
jgi:hypothetical protein